jgi:Flp pilus assembly pilin Flp
MQGIISLLSRARNRLAQIHQPGLPKKHYIKVMTRVGAERTTYMELVRRLWCEQEGQDIAEYAVMLAVILVIVVGTVRLIGSNANNVFSSVASSIQ